MSAIEILPSLKQRKPFDEARFLRFLKSRSEDERWELIDGEPIQMMMPPTLRHQRIATNFGQLLNRVLESSRPELFTVHEVGLSIEAHPTFRPVADLAVISSEIEDDRIFAERFYLAAEILSASNTREHISLKRERYADCPDCLHVLIVGQDDFHVEVWSRSNNWQGRVYRSADDRIELPAFGFSCAVGDLYRGTPVR